MHGVLPLALTVESLVKFDENILLTKLCLDHTVFDYFTDLVIFCLIPPKTFYVPSCIHPTVSTCIAAKDLPMQSTLTCCKLKFCCFEYSTVVLVLNGLFHRVPTMQPQYLVKQVWVQFHFENKLLLKLIKLTKSFLYHQEHPKSKSFLFDL